MEIIAHELCQISSVKRINHRWEFIIVELEADESTYESRSLPGIVAGCATVYHHSDNIYWRGMARIRRWITHSVAEDIQDATNYLITGSGELQPGVTPSSTSYDINREPQMSLATISGFLDTKKWISSQDDLRSPWLAKFQRGVPSTGPKWGSDRPSQGKL